MRWEPVGKLTEFDFIEGDLKFIRELGRLSILVRMAPRSRWWTLRRTNFWRAWKPRARRANHFFRTMANRPEVLKTFVPFYAAVRGRGPWSAASRNWSTWPAPTPTSAPTARGARGRRQKAGIAEEELRALQTEQDDGFSEPERAAIRYARELTQTADAEETARALVEHFTSEQIVEITLVAAMANFTNRFNNGLGIEPET